MKVVLQRKRDGRYARKMFGKWTDDLQQAKLFRSPSSARARAFYSRGQKFDYEIVQVEVVETAMRRDG